MSLSSDRQRLSAALERARHDLFAERTRAGHWVGQLSSSPLATATAISALVIAEQSGSPEEHGRKADRLFDANQIFQSDLSELIVQSLHWLACQQNEDGGWGDAEESRSELTTTMLVNAAFHLTGVPAKYSGLLERAEKYIQQHGGVPAIRKLHAAENALAIPILANYALAGLVPWSEVPPLPFELAAMPRTWYRAVQRFRCVRYDLPALIAVGQARFYNAPPWNPIDRAVRRFSRPRSMKLIETMQPESGGFLEGIPLTSIVIMCLASSGLAEHPVVRRGVGFLLANVRGDGSWPLQVNMAARNTAYAISALWGGRAGRGLSRLGPADEIEPAVQWLLNVQHADINPYTHAAPGGWAWTDASGGVPNTVDTSAALVALANSVEEVGPAVRRRSEAAARRGIRWLLALQNRDGGWPTFCRSGGRRVLGRSGSDLTADALRALALGKARFVQDGSGKGLAARIERSTERALSYLHDQQQEDGSWVPFWFGNQNNPRDENPVYGTSRVLIALAELGYRDSEMARRGGDWLCRMQHASGGWGPIVLPGKPAGGRRMKAAQPVPHEPVDRGPSVEETAIAVAALARLERSSPQRERAFEQGLAWLIEAVENGRHQEPVPIGFYFARVWYYDRLLPQVLAAEALQASALAIAAAERTESYFPASLQPTSR